MTDFNRCRLMLAASPERASQDLVSAALEAGDVAGLILYCHGEATHMFEPFCEAVIPDAQSRDVAVLVADDSQVAGRSGADGYFLDRDRTNLNDAIARFSPQKIVGCGGMLDRHQALKLGETGIEFLMFGKLGRDTRPEPHRKNLALAQWWAEFVELPCVILAGNSLDSVIEAAKTGADFVMLDQAVFGDGATQESVREAIAKVNSLLDDHAPLLEEADA